VHRPRETRLGARTAALCGIVGPMVFAGVVAVLTLLQRDFLRTLGWNALTAPTRDWPSGLALGPLGFAMTAAFLACGMLLVLFGLGLRASLRPVPVGSAASVLLALAGFAMCFLAFATDPTNSTSPATLHGRIHDTAFAVMGAALFASLAAFGLAFRGAGRWASAVSSWATAVLIVPSFALKGPVFYFFLAAFLAWCEVTAFQLLRAAKRAGSLPPRLLPTRRRPAGAP
jgi:hypothetical protein